MKSKHPRHLVANERRQQEILDAAESIWLERGLAGGSVDVIAARVGIAKGTVYLYWMNQRELMEAVRERLRRRSGILDEHVGRKARDLALLLELELALDRESCITHLGGLAPLVSAQLCLGLSGGANPVGGEPCKSTKQEP